jgi:hypothetical protein
MMIQSTNCPDDQIARTTCYRTRYPIQVDRHLNEAAWQEAASYVQVSPNVIYNNRMEDQ